MYFLKHIGRRFPGKKLAILLDNSGIHKGIEVKTLLEELDIVPIYMPPYCPEFNGVEKLWALMKFKFRKKLTEMKIRKKKFKVLDVVKVVLNGIDSP